MKDPRVLRTSSVRCWDLGLDPLDCIKGSQWFPDLSIDGKHQWFHLALHLCQIRQAWGDSDCLQTENRQKSSYHYSWIFEYHNLQVGTKYFVYKLCLWQFLAPVCRSEIYGPYQDQAVDLTVSFTCWSQWCCCQVAAGTTMYNHLLSACIHNCNTIMRMYIHTRIYYS